MGIKEILAVLNELGYKRSKSQVYIKESRNVNHFIEVYGTGSLRFYGIESTDNYGEKGNIVYNSGILSLYNSSHLILFCNVFFDNNQ